jgi:hypothetical protein
LAAIRRCRGDHNRLGYALMRCYLRFPGRAYVSASDHQPRCWPSLSAQLDILPDCIDEYLATERNRQRHAIECQEQLGLCPFGRRAASELMETLLVQAIENDRLAFLAELVMQTCRARGIIVLSPAVLERLCAICAIVHGRKHIVS